MTTGEQIGESVYLRALELDDIDRTYLWHNDPALYDSLTGMFRYVSRAVEEEWLHKAQAASTQQVNLAICLAANAQHIGNIYLRDIDWVARHAELHIFIYELQHRGRGYGREAVRMLLEYAFQQLGLYRVYLFVLSENALAIRSYQACGFLHEGTLRGHAFKGGQFKDVWIMGMCNENLR